MALKILKARFSEQNNELDFFQRLSIVQPGEAEHPGWAHIVNLLDTFVIQGPNGVHRCLVLELMGLSVRDILRGVGNYVGSELPVIPPDSLGADCILPYPIVKAIARQALLGLAYLHGRGISHGGQSRYHPINTRLGGWTPGTVMALGRYVVNSYSTW